MRGIAILAIFMHNFIHWLKPMAQENEYTFSQQNVDRLVQVVTSPDKQIWEHLFSFFGHYGVPIFVFLSGFGLVMKYEKKSQLSTLPEAITPQLAIPHYVWSNFKKLFLLMGTGFCFYVLVNCMTPDPHEYEFWNVLGQLGMFSNFFPHPEHVFKPGPYWYFGLTLQLYLLYRFIFCPCRYSLARYIPQRMQTAFVVTIATLSVVLQFCCQPDGDTLNWLRYNAVGSILPFAAGMLFARSSRNSQYSLPVLISVLVLSLIGIGAGSLYFVTWLLVPLCCISLVLSFIKLMPGSVLRPFSWLGGISAAVFVCHPIARMIIINITSSGNHSTGILLYVFTTIILSIVFHRLIAIVSGR